MLEPRQHLAIEALVAGATEEQAARAGKCGRTTLWRWRERDDFALALKTRIKKASEIACEMLGAHARLSLENAVLGDKIMNKLMKDPAMPPWIHLQAAHSAQKSGGWAGDKYDPEFRKLETVGKNDPQRQQVADDVTRKVAVAENRERILARLQEVEERRAAQYVQQLEDRLRRRATILARHDPQTQAYLNAYYRRLDDHYAKMEEIRQAQARKDFAIAAEVKQSDLPPAPPLTWADLKEQFKDLVLPAQAPATRSRDYGSQCKSP